MISHFRPDNVLENLCLAEKSEFIYDQTRENIK